jgi:NADP-dependent 3-hydroxy acid dehydrogenase YdfG
LLLLAAIRAAIVKRDLTDGSDTIPAVALAKRRHMILITGASGFVGSAVVRRLLQSGHQVRALVRPTTSRVNLAGLALEIVAIPRKRSRIVSRRTGRRYLRF